MTDIQDMVKDKIREAITRCSDEVGALNELNEIYLDVTAAMWLVSEEANRIRTLRSLEDV